MEGLDEYLIIRMDDGTWVWHLGVIKPEERDDLVTAARAAVGFQVDETWIQDLDRASVQLAFGEPHPDIMGKAVIGNRADLLKIDANMVADHRAARATAAIATQIESAKVALAGLSPDQIADVVAQIRSREV